MSTWPGPRPGSFGARLATILPRQVMMSPSRTSPAKRTPSLATVPAPIQSVTDWATKPMDSMPWPNTSPIPAALANAASW
jgi:hypothetical protein